MVASRTVANRPGDRRGYWQSVLRTLSTPTAKRLGKQAMKVALAKTLEYARAPRESSNSANKKRKLIVKSDGVTYNTKVIKRSHGTGPIRGKSLKKRVLRLEKEAPKSSKKNINYCKLFKIPKTTNPNAVRMCEFVFTDQAYWETIGQLNSMGGSSATDFTAEKTSITVKNGYCKMTMKNNCTTNAEVSLCWVACKDSTNNSVLTDYVQEGGFRGYTFTNTVSAEAGETAVTSAYPSNLVLDGAAGSYGAERNYPKDLAFRHVRSHWRNLTGWMKYIIGPGDTLTTNYKIPTFAYKPEAYDTPGSNTYIRGNYDIHLIVFIKGTLAHDDTNVNKVGFANPTLDCEARTLHTYVYSDGKGLKEVRYQNTINSTGLTAPTHADNNASAIELDNE